MTQLKIARLTAEERKQIEAEEILRIITENTHHLLDIELEVELDFGTIFCWIRRGLKTSTCKFFVDGKSSTRATKLARSKSRSS